MLPTKCSFAQDSFAAKIFEAHEGNAFVAGNEIAIGYTYPALTDLQVDANNERVITNPEHPDGPVFRV